MNTYKIPKFLIASFFIVAGIVLVILNDPPHTFCDSQVEQFKKLQEGYLYDNPKDFHKEKSLLNRKKKICQTTASPGACYEYFSYLDRLLKDFRVLSKDCTAKVFAEEKVKTTLSSALSLIVRLAWREEVLTGRVSQYNWLSKPDMILFCKIKKWYILQYGSDSYQKLENKILTLLPSQQKVSPKLLKRRSILSEPCPYSI